MSDKIWGMPPPDDDGWYIREVCGGYWGPYRPETILLLALDETFLIDDVVVKDLRHHYNAITIYELLYL
jgi:hypothetical protein